MDDEIHLTVVPDKSYKPKNLQQVDWLWGPRKKWTDRDFPPLAPPVDPIEPADAQMDKSDEEKSRLENKNTPRRMARRNRPTRASETALLGVMPPRHLRNEPLTLAESSSKNSTKVLLTRPGT